MWGRRIPPSPPGYRRRNTPTGVGKTRRDAADPGSPKKHPHGCGEDHGDIPAALDALETPPRVWGRQSPSGAVVGRSGNTPTGVGKTCLAAPSASRRQKHPHGCGEDGLASRYHGSSMETPPRVWGRLALTNFGLAAIQKHPHGCGEDQSKRRTSSTASETPPRVWGRRFLGSPISIEEGNTPTGVGKTLPKPLLSNGLWKHPHGCGEDQTGMITSLAPVETPPRVWGRQRQHHHQRAAGGNTPTGVGKTFACDSLEPLTRKHPHGCGEDWRVPAALRRYEETPPRVWGRRP